MKIELFKIDGHFHRITIMRDDGSSSSVILDTKTYFLHDLCHYFVEKELKYQKGFWGLLTMGHDFSEMNGKQNPLTEDLKFIEKIVGPLQSVVSGHIAAENFEFSIAYLNTEASKNLSPRKLTEQVNQFMQHWKELPYGQEMRLEFEIQI